MKDYGFTMKTIRCGERVCRTCAVDNICTCHDICYEFCDDLLELLIGFDKYVREIEGKSNDNRMRDLQVLQK